MGALLKLLTGKKTFLISIVGVGVVWARQHLWIDESTYNWILPLLGFGGAVTIRIAIMNALGQIANLLKKD